MGREGAEGPSVPTPAPPGPACSGSFVSNGGHWARGWAGTPRTEAPTAGDLLMGVSEGGPEREGVLSLQGPPRQEVSSLGQGLAPWRGAVTRPPVTCAWPSWARVPGAGWRGCSTIPASPCLLPSHMPASAQAACPQGFPEASQPRRGVETESQGRGQLATSGRAGRLAMLLPYL